MGGDFVLVIPPYQNPISFVIRGLFYYVEMLTDEKVGICS